MKLCESQKFRSNRKTNFFGLTFTESNSRLKRLSRYLHRIFESLVFFFELHIVTFQSFDLHFELMNRISKFTTGVGFFATAAVAAVVRTC